MLQGQALKLGERKGVLTGQRCFYQETQGLLSAVMTVGQEKKV